MKNILALLALTVALAANAINITNYPVVGSYSSNEWFLLSSVTDKTNYNLPGNYVASSSQLSTVSNQLASYISTITNVTYVTNNVYVTNENYYTNYEYYTNTTYVTNDTYVTNLVGFDWSGTNAVVTNAVALKYPVITNGSTVFYLLLFTNVP